MTFHSDGVRASSFLFFICSQRKTNKQSLFIGLLHLFEFGAGFKNHPKQIRLSFENKQNFHKNTRISNQINRFRNSQFVCGIFRHTWTDDHRVSFDFVAISTLHARTHCPKD